MSPAKDEGSSRRKGKEVATNDPSTKTIGKEAPLSKLDHFEEEEGGCDPNNECPPLIDSWYDTHIHFPVVLGDYLPPPLGHGWLSICCHDMEISWVPLASTIPDLDICQGTLNPMHILFKFRSGTFLVWKEWVDKELSDMGFMAALRQAGMLKTIVSSHCLSNYRDLFNLRHLVRRWCSAAHTFFLSCSEITGTLKDVANQLLLPILDDADPSNIELSIEEEAMETELRKGMSGNAKLLHWVGTFSKASDVIRYAAFVAFWLCKFIFSSHLYYVVKPLYFHLAIKISTEVSLLVAPMFLIHLYVQLDIL